MCVQCQVLQLDQRNDHRIPVARYFFGLSPDIIGNYAACDLAIQFCNEGGVRRSFGKFVVHALQRNFMRVATLTSGLLPEIGFQPTAGQFEDAGQNARRLQGSLVECSWPAGPRRLVCEYRHVR